MPSSADCPALARRLRHEAPTHISWLQLQTGALAPWHEPPSPIPHMSPPQRPPSQNLSVTNAANSRLESFLFPSAIFEQRNQRSNVCPSEQQSYDKHPQTPPCAAPKFKRIYLPAGSDWFNFWTNERFHGGQRMIVSAPIETIPVFVRAGSILSLCASVQ